jgi:dienelactone hydrolase
MATNPSNIVPSERFRLTRRGVLTGLSAIALTDRAHASVTRVSVRESNFAGALFLPAHPSDQAAVVCLTGAAGGLSEAPAKALAAEGHAALALATHNFPGRQETLRLLPLDQIEQATAWLRLRVEPRRDFVALRGWSRGGEAALLLASLTSSVNAVIAYAPRCYVALEQGKQNNFADPRAVAAWTWRGSPATGDALPTSMLKDPSHQTFEDQFGIAVERIKGPVMLISGEADTGLAGTTAGSSCEAAMRRMELFGFRYPHQHLSYPDAGHFIAGPPPFAGKAEEGGSEAGDAAAVADSWPRSLAFLREAAL